MPFPKIRLKKSKQQYNVASKSAFVITVELLDQTTVECTLTAESTGNLLIHLVMGYILWLENTDFGQVPAWAIDLLSTKIYGKGQLKTILRETMVFVELIKVNFFHDSL